MGGAMPMAQFCLLVAFVADAVPRTRFWYNAGLYAPCFVVGLFGVCPTDLPVKRHRALHGIGLLGLVIPLVFV